MPLFNLKKTRKKGIAVHTRRPMNTERRPKPAVKKEKDGTIWLLVGIVGIWLFLIALYLAKNV